MGGAYLGDSTQLTYLRARFYASNTGRFLTRDTWGGDDNNPMSYNLWNYTQSNPINYTDPSGNVPCSMLPPGERPDCEDYNQSIPKTIRFYSQGRAWTSQDKQAVYDGVVATTLAFRRLIEHMGHPPMLLGDVFAKIFGTVSFHASSVDPDNDPILRSYYCERYTPEPTGVICYKDSINRVTGPLIAHELAHVYNATFSNRFPGAQTPYNALSSLITAGHFSYVDNTGVSRPLAEYRQYQAPWYINGLPVIRVDRNNNPVLGQPGDEPINHWESQLWRNPSVGQNTNYIFSSRRLVGEEFADMFSNWVYDGFTGPAGTVRNIWMTNRLQADMSLIFGLPLNPYPPTGDCNWYIQ
jgi:RHS repeat-associated protein